MSEFWTLVDDEFGRGQGRALVHDHVVGALGHRTAEQALEAGEDARDVWFALCDDLQVPTERRWGRQEQGRAAGARAGAGRERAARPGQRRGPAPGWRR
jgi:hypothetical protein